MSREAPGELVPALATLRCLSFSARSLYVTLGAKNLPPPTLPPLRNLLHLVSRFSRPSPLTVGFRSPTLRVGGGSSTEPERIPVTDFGSHGVAFITDACDGKRFVVYKRGVLSASALCSSGARGGASIKSADSPLITFGLESLTDSSKVTQLACGRAGTTRHILLHLVPYI